MIDNQNVGKTIAALRQAKGLSQQGLASLCAVTHQAVSKWENGMALPDMQILLFLSKLFQVSMEDILTGQALPAQEAPAEENAPVPDVAPAAQEAQEEAVSAEEPEQEEEAPVASPEAESDREDEDNEDKAEDEDNEEIPDMAWEKIEELAPFASTEMMDQLVRNQKAKQGAKISLRRLGNLLPFLSKGTIEELFTQFIGESDAPIDVQALMQLAPFVSGEFLANTLRKLGNRVNVAHALRCLAAFLPQSMVDELIRGQIKQGRSAAPQLAETPVREEQPDNLGDWAGLTSQAPMLDSSQLDFLIHEQLHHHGAKGLDWGIASSLFPFAGEAACNAMARALVSTLGQPRSWQKYAVLPFVDEEILVGKGKQPQDAPAADPGKERLILRIARKAIQDENEDWLEEHAGELNPDEALTIGQLAVEKDMWDVVSALWQQMDGDARKRMLAKIIQAENWDLLEDLSEHADDETVRQIAQAAIQAQKWDLVEELSEHADDETLRQIAQAAIQAQKWDLVEELSEHADDETLRQIAQAAIQAENWDLLEDLAVHADDETLRQITQAAIQAENWDLLEDLAVHADQDTLQLMMEAALDHSQWDLIDVVRAYL